MLNWTKLFDRAKNVRAQREEEVERAREDERVRADAEQWMQATVPKVMQDLAEQASGRANQFLQQTGVEIWVHGPDADAPINLTAPWLSYMTIHLGSCTTYLYATRGRGIRLYLHLISDAASWPRKHQRMMSHPGCAVSPDGASYRFHHLQGDAGPNSDEPMGADALLFRAFELLFDAHAE